jgi:hypothetical protein
MVVGWEELPSRIHHSLLLILSPCSHRFLPFLSSFLSSFLPHQVLLAKKILKTQTVTRVENVEMAKPEFREPWVLPNSIFKPRVKESDSKNFFDTEQVRFICLCGWEGGWEREREREEGDEGGRGALRSEGPHQPMRTILYVCCRSKRRCSRRTGRGRRPRKSSPVRASRRSLDI